MIGKSRIKGRRIVMALCASLAISACFTAILGRTLQAHAPKPEPPLIYIAPARAIENGQVLRAADLQTSAWPRNLPIAGAFTKTSDLVGRTLLFPIEKGQPVLARDVSEVGAGTGLAARVPDGMRAIALRSDDIVGVGGFLNPGSHVDVLVTYKLSGESESSTATALQNAQVLATGQRLQPDPAGKPESVTVVTLLLTPDDAERAVLASTQGSVHFVLRNNSDTSKTEAGPMQLSRLSGKTWGEPAPTAAPVPHAARAPRPIQEPGIETILDQAPEAAAGRESK